MKRQYTRLFSFLIGLSFILSGIIFAFVNNYKAEKKKRIEAEIVIGEKIDDNYKSFYDKEKELSEFRDKFVDDIQDFSSFYQNMETEYKTVKSEIEEYETIIKGIDDNSSYLKEVCVKRYSVLEANEKCDAYYINLEKSINLFVGDLEFLNSKIEEYNKWADEENALETTLEKHDKLDSIDASYYKDYVDLNDDGTYLSKKKK